MNSLWNARFGWWNTKLIHFCLKFIHLIKTIRNHYKESKLEEQSNWFDEFLHFQHIFSFFHFLHHFFQISIFIHLTNHSSQYFYTRPIILPLKKCWKWFYDEEDIILKFQIPFAVFSNLSKFMKFQLNQLYHFIYNYTNIPSSIFNDLNGNAVMMELFEWWILNIYFSIVFQHMTNDLKKSFWDKTNNFLFHSFFSFHLK